MCVLTRPYFNVAILELGEPDMVAVKEDEMPDSDSSCNPETKLDSCRLGQFNA